MQNIKEKVELVGKILAIYVATTYSLGFFVWNIYSQFFSVAPKLFQGTYILTGTLLVLSCVGLVGFFLFLKTVLVRLFNLISLPNFVLIQKDSKISDFAKFLFTFCISIFFIYVFSIYLFPATASYFGGARPKLISVIADEEQINFLEKFGIKKASNIQTAILCSAYEDDKNIVFVLDDRILSFKKDNFRGFARLKYYNEHEDIKKCNDTILTNIIGWRKLIIENQN